MTRRIRVTGKDSDFLHLATPSWTRMDGPEHDLWVSLKDGTIGCSCEDASYRKKQGALMPTGKETPCKHQLAVMNGSYCK
jgi:hypothetical protein